MRLAIHYIAESFANRSAGQLLWRISGVFTAASGGPSIRSTCSWLWFYGSSAARPTASPGTSLRPFRPSEGPCTLRGWGFVMNGQSGRDGVPEIVLSMTSVEPQF
jgi:hypothetical protein